MPTHNSDIFVRLKKVTLFRVSVTIWVIEGGRIEGIDLNIGFKRIITNTVFEIP